MNYYSYFSEIEELFIRRRGRNLLLSPLDWALIEDWQERDIPLKIVLRGIEKVFDAGEKTPAKKRPVKSLFYCREEVEAQFAAWSEMQTGKTLSPKSKVQSPKSVEVQSSEFKVQGLESEEENSENQLFSAETIAAHLEKIYSELNAAQAAATGELRDVLEAVSKSLAQLRGRRHAAEMLEEQLEKLDAQIDRCLIKNSATEELKTATEKNLTTYKGKMETDVYQRTIELMMLKNLRDAAAIPRLSLFYL